MPTTPQMHLPKTYDENEFEKMCCDILNKLYNRTSTDCFELYAGKGEKQYGIDIRGVDLNNTTSSTPIYIVAQCKNYLSANNDTALTKIIKKDVFRIHNELSCSVSRLIIMTSRDRTEKLQKLITDLQCQYPFKIEIKFWDDLEAIIIQDASLMKRYYKDYIVPKSQRNLLCIIQKNKHKKCMLLLIVLICILVIFSMFKMTYVNNMPTYHETCYTYPDDGNSEIISPDE